MIATFTTDLDSLTFDNVAKIKAALGRPVLPGDDGFWILGQDLEVELTDGLMTTVTVPRGFTTDGASVPYLAQLVTGWHPWDVPQRWGAIVHDYAYSLNGSDAAAGIRCAKDFADQAFRACLVAAGAHPVRAETMYLAVHFFGGHAYESDQAQGPNIFA